MTAWNTIAVDSSGEKLRPSCQTLCYGRRLTRRRRVGERKDEGRENKGMEIAVRPSVVCDWLIEPLADVQFDVVLRSLRDFQASFQWPLPSDHVYLLEGSVWISIFPVSALPVRSTSFLSRSSFEPRCDLCWEHFSQIFSCVCGFINCVSPTYDLYGWLGINIM